MLRTALIILILNTPCYAYRVYICDPNLPKTQKEVVERKKAQSKIVRSPDQNGDGIVNMFDLAIIAKRWLEK